MNNNIQLLPLGPSLDASFLESPVPFERQERIVSHLWGTSIGYKKQHFRPYFQYYTEQCRVASHSHGSRLPIRTHQHIVDIANYMHTGCTRSAVKDFISQSQWTTEPTSEAAINASIDLTVRLLLMLDVGEFQNAYSGRKKLLWVEGSLNEFVQETLTQATSLDHDMIRFDSAFKVCNMVRIAGFRVELTCNLSDHLRLRDIDKTVTVFHHASFLMAHRQTSIFPAGLVDETLATLALLFPRGDKETERWYRKQVEPDELDTYIGRCGTADRQIGEYTYWHDRLVILKAEFDDSKPSTMTQWWNDRREGSQWYAIWSAIVLTVLFGLVQSIEGALQVYKAYNP